MSFQRHTQRSGALADHSMSVALAFGFAGLTYHNLREFPLSVLWRGDTLILLALTVALGVWWARSRSLGAAAALLAWGVLHLVGGGLVVGGGLIAAVRDLTGSTAVYELEHHLSHWIYGAAHLPLVRLAWVARFG